MKAFEHPAPAPIERPQAICTGCKKKPEELTEYSPLMTGEDTPADDFVWSNEGTLNLENGHFLCTDCYIEAGMPSAPAPGRWVAP